MTRSSMIREMSISHYLENLASNSATPGGGAVAALTLAQAAALVSMACAYTIDRDKYKSVKDQVHGISAYANRILKQALDAADEDSQAYEQVLAAYKLPSHSPAEIQAKNTKIQSALKEAALVPWRLLELCQGLLEKAVELRPICNPNLISDVDVAVCLLQSAAESLWINVEVNLRSIQSEKNSESWRTQASKNMIKIRSVTPEPIRNLLSKPPQQPD